jgi:hypothetical protein
MIIDNRSGKVKILMLMHSQVLMIVRRNERRMYDSLICDNTKDFSVKMNMDSWQPIDRLLLEERMVCN